MVVKDVIAIVGHWLEIINSIGLKYTVNRLLRE